MANDGDELFVAGDGKISIAPYGTALPTSISTPLNAAFIEMGYLTPDGYRMTQELTTVDIEAWQSQTPVRTIVQSRPITLALDFLQGNETTLKLYFGGGSFAGTVYTPPAAGVIDERSLVADVYDGTRNWRFWFPKVTLAATREISFTRSAAAQFGVDLKVLSVGTSPAFQFDRADPEFYPGAYP